MPDYDVVKLELLTRTKVVGTAAIVVKSWLLWRHLSPVLNFVEDTPSSGGFGGGGDRRHRRAADATLLGAERRPHPADVRPRRPVVSPEA